jgi:hypothetical protein
MLAATLLCVLTQWCNNNYDDDDNNNNNNNNKYQELANEICAMWKQKKQYK